MFLHQVSMSFDQNSTTPSQNVSLMVSASQGSFVGILAVDQSALLLKQGNDITQDMVGFYILTTIMGKCKCSRFSLATMLFFNDFIGRHL